jgi:hypothetical protein
VPPAKNLRTLEKISDFFRQNIFSSRFLHREAIQTGFQLRGVMEDAFFTAIVLKKPLSCDLF